MNHPNPNITRVVFFQVIEPAAKIQKIIETATIHFEKKEPILIAVEDEKSLHFVDELLWKYPKTSFLPHIVSKTQVPDWITITKEKINLNNARIAFNLCPTALFLQTPFRLIYEFEDLTAPIKKNLSSQRFDAYKKAGFIIEARAQENRS